MKLHAWEATINEKRYRAYTRDKAGKKIKQPLSVTSGNIIIPPSGWSYKRMISTTGDNSEDAKELHRALKTKGVAVYRLPPIYKHFFVFEAELDYADIRIYSKDKELSSFNEFWHRLKLSPNGDFYLGKDPTLIGEVDIENEITAEQMGLDFDKLQYNEFLLKVVREPPHLVTLERKLNRELPEMLSKDLEKYGIKILDAKVSVKKSSSNTNEPHPQNTNSNSINQNINIQNLLPENKTTPKSGNTIFSNWIVQLIGLLAAILGILAFFAIGTNNNWKDIIKTIISFIINALET